MFLKKLRVAGLATMMVLASSTSIFAADFSPEAHTEPTPASDFVYDIAESGDGLKITDYKGNSSVIVVPATIEDFPVHEIRLGKRGDDTVEYIILSANVNYVDMSGNTALKGVHFAKDYSVTEIKTLDFKGCKNLTKINFPATVTKIGKLSCGYCESLTTLIIPSSVESIGEVSMFSSAITHLITWSGMKYINGDDDPYNGPGAGVYYDCKNLKEVIIPDAVTYIPMSTFEYTNIERLVLSANLKRIELRAFQHCYNLKEIVVPEGLSQVGFSSYSFGGCRSLTLKSKAALIKLGFNGNYSTQIEK